VRLQNPRINQVQTKSTKLSWQRFRAHNKRWEMVRVRSKESTVSKRFLHVFYMFVCCSVEQKNTCLEQTFKITCEN
jgi:hypothetical protein